MFNPQLDNLTWRSVHIYKKKSWITTNLIEIRKNDHFRMFEPNGMSVEHEDGRSEFIAESDAYINVLVIPEISIC